YNETDGRPILPTPTVAVVGQLEAIEHRLGLGFQRPGDVVALLGDFGPGSLGGSEWLTRRTGRVGGQPPTIDLRAERALQDAVLYLARAQALRSAHDLSDGGLAVALSEACIALGRGAHIKLPELSLPLESVLFGEDPSRVLVSFDEKHRSQVEEACQRHGVPFYPLGLVEDGDELTIDGVSRWPLSALAAAHEAALDAVT
ncbi:MAG: AIR synthase-related protein, partial [Myxococcota bacterium]